MCDIREWSEKTHRLPAPMGNTKHPCRKIAASMNKVCLSKEKLFASGLDHLYGLGNGLLVKVGAKAGMVGAPR